MTPLPWKHSSELERKCVGGSWWLRGGCKEGVIASGQISSREGKEGGNSGGRRRERWAAL